MLLNSIANTSTYTYYRLHANPHVQTLTTLFCPDLPHKLLFLAPFPSYGLTGISCAIPVLLFSRPLLVPCCAEGSHANAPQLLHERTGQRLQELLGRTEAICAGTGVKENIAGPSLSPVFCSSVHFYAFEENILQNIRLEMNVRRCSVPEVGYLCLVQVAQL